jgi:hypothetical protein
VLSDPSFDLVDPDVRNDLLTKAVGDQIRYMRATTSFWAQRLNGCPPVDSLADLAQVRILTKAEFRSIAPIDLLTAEAGNNL